MQGTSSSYQIPGDSGSAQTLSGLNVPLAHGVVS